METLKTPIACRLTALELQLRRTEVLERVRNAVIEVNELEKGYAYRFPSDVSWITELAALIASEHLCCPFLRFNLHVEADDGPIWLELTGPDGTKEFLKSIFV